MLTTNSESGGDRVRLSPKGWWLSCFFGALTQAVLLGWYYLPRAKRLIGDEGYYFNLAKKIAAGVPAGHHPFWPPLYAETIGTVFSLFGQHIWLIQVLQIALLFASAWLLRDVLWRLTSSPLLANLSACFLLVNPEMAAFAHYLWPEVPHVFLMVAAFWCWVRWPKGLLVGGLVGVLLALALLTKLLLLPFLPVMFAGLFLFEKDRGRLAMRMGVLAVAMALTLAPTVWANKKHHDKWMVADSSLFNLWVGLNDSEPADYRNDIAGPTFQEWEASGETWPEKNRVFQSKLDRLADEKGWLALMVGQFPRQYRRLLDPHSFMVTQMPGGARAAYTGQDGWLARFWVGYAMAWHLLFLALAALGVALVPWRKTSFWWLLGLYLIYNLAVLWWVHVKTRYMLQMHPAMIPFAVLPLLHFCLLVTRRAGKSAGPCQRPVMTSDRAPKLRWGAGGVLALALWLLALWPR